MYIAKFKISNYKSFNSTDFIELTPGINIITGQNNSGKTALLEALSLRFSSNPHRSSQTIPFNQATIANPNSEIEIQFCIEESELIKHIFDEGEFRMPSVAGINFKEIKDNESFFRTYFGNEIRINSRFAGSNLQWAEFDNLNHTVERNAIVNFRVDRKSRNISYSTRAPGSGDSSSKIISRLINRLYSFKAERLNISQAAFGPNSDLSSNASNLPEVINILQGDTYRFARFNSYVKRVFPNIFNISTRPSNGSLVQIMVWNEDPKLERSDLTVPLSECGTGLSQVLAILYVVLTSDLPKIIIIDEPNSFLHPGAARKLIEILKEHKQHQFVISTHSPSTLAASNPKTIHVLKTIGAQSIVESIDITKTNQQQAYLAEIGAKLSDVFGADSILWVEGKTEELCFPKIVERMASVSVMGSVILSVVNTGDFQKKKNAELVFSIYQKLSSGKGLVPSAIGFVFDSEKLTQQDRDDLKRRSNGNVKFLERRMFENYLINPKAIKHVLDSNQEIVPLSIELAQIENWIEKNKWESSYIESKHSKSKDESTWLTFADGANLLNGLFQQLTNSKLVFDKIRHSVALCDWIIENSFSDLKEIQSILSEYFKLKD